jgi:hypothetical protein
MNGKLQISHFKIVAAIAAIILLAGCVGRTGKVGRPISDYYQQQLESLKLGESTPDDLKRAFTITKEVKGPNQTRTTTTTKVLVSLKEAKIENSKKVEIWEVAKGGNMDVAAFLVWGYVAYNKDQQLLFRFEDGKLVSYESVVIPDPVTASVTPASKTASQR